MKQDEDYYMEVESFRTTPSLLEKVKKYAKDHGISKSQAYRILIGKGLK